MWKTILGDRFDPGTYGGTTEDRGLCFSSWRFSNGITHLVTAVTFSSIAGADDHFSKAIDLVYVNENGDMGDSDWGDQAPWAMFEFSEIKILSKVVMKIRNQFDAHTRNVMIETSTDGSKFDLFYDFGPNEVTLGIIHTCEGINGPTRMKFVRISRSQKHLILPEVAFVAARE